MFIALGLIVITFGFFFLSLGMLFINYDLSPLKFVVKSEDVFTRYNFGIKIMIPGFILFYLASVIMSN